MTIQVDTPEKLRADEDLARLLATRLTNDEIRAQLEDVADATEYPAVRRVMERAMRLLESDGLERAVSELLTEMARVKRTERQLLWAMPLVLLIALVFLLHALRTLVF